jgi:hypothetical protein
MSKTVKYYLLLRDPFPLMRKDGRRSRVYGWQAVEEGTLGFIRKIQKSFEGKTKIIRETVISETVKEKDSY